jgi:hypothetical protein
MKRFPVAGSQSDRRFFSGPTFSHLPCGRCVRKILTELVCADFTVRSGMHGASTFDLEFGDLEFGK